MGAGGAIFSYFRLNNVSFQNDDLFGHNFCSQATGGSELVFLEVKVCFGITRLSKTYFRENGILLKFLILLFKS